MNDKTLLPFLRDNPSKPVEPRGTSIRVPQRPKPAFQQPMSPELGDVAFKRQSDEPRIHLGHVHRPLDKTSFGFFEAFRKESMTRRERFAFFFFLRIPEAFRIVPSDIRPDRPLVEAETAPIIIPSAQLFG